MLMPLENITNKQTYVKLPVKHFICVRVSSLVMTFSHEIDMNDYKSKR